MHYQVENSDGEFFSNLFLINFNNNELFFIINSRAYRGILKCNLKYRNKKEKEKLLKITFKTSTLNSNHNHNSHNI